MNTLRNVLAGLAFVFAAGFAFVASSATTHYGVDPEDELCKIGTLQQIPAQCTTITQTVRCTVKLSNDEIVPAFDNISGTACTQAMWKL